MTTSMFNQLRKKTAPTIDRTACAHNLSYIISLQLVSTDNMNNMLRKHAYSR